MYETDRPGIILSVYWAVKQPLTKPLSYIRIVHKDSHSEKKNKKKKKKKKTTTTTTKNHISIFFIILLFLYYFSVGPN